MGYAQRAVDLQSEETLVYKQSYLVQLLKQRYQPASAGFSLQEDR